MSSVSQLEAKLKAAQKAAHAAQQQQPASPASAQAQQKRGPGRPKTPLLPHTASSVPPPTSTSTSTSTSAPAAPRAYAPLPASVSLPVSLPASVSAGLNNRAARRILDELTLRSLQQSGSHNPFVAAARLNATLLRQLDHGAAPAWLRSADERARAELDAWHIARRLPASADAPDPGVPTAEDIAHAASFPFVRPASEEDDKDAKVVEYLKCRRSIVYFVDNYCKLAHKERGVIPFRLWPWQAWLLWQWSAHDKCVNLKARQLGVSELAAGFAGALTLFHDTKLALLISRGEDEAMELLGRWRVMEAHLPQWLLPSVGDAPNPACVNAVAQSKSNTRMLEYVHFDAEGAPLPSRLESLPATPGTGRSRTAALVVLDEWAHMQWAADIWAGVKATADGGGRVLGISTANGVGNIFERIYSAAADARENAQDTTAQPSQTPQTADAPKRGPGRPARDRTAGFFPVFLSWRRHPERDDDWYAAQRAEYEAEDHLPILHQEYPAEALEAFIQSGRPVFDQAYLSEHQRRIREEHAERVAQGLPPWRARDGVTIYEDPTPGHDYIIGADTAEGREGGDFDAAVIVCRQTGREVAALHGHWPFEVYAAKLDELGYRYNRALLAVESNNHGHSVILALNSGLAHEQWDAGKRVAYPNLYHYKPEDTTGAHQRRQVGWITNIRTKPMAVNSLGRALREQVYFPRDEAFLSEAKFFSWDETGKACGAPPGKHDDRVACRWIAAHLLLQPDDGALALSYLRTWHQATWTRVATIVPAEAERAGREMARAHRLAPAPTPAGSLAESTSELESESESEAGVTVDAVPA